MRRQVLIGAAAGVLVGAALVAGLWAYDGTAAFASERVTVLRLGCGACFVALGVWLLRRRTATAR